METKRLIPIKLKRFSGLLLATIITTSIVFGNINLVFADESEKFTTTETTNAKQTQTFIIPNLHKVNSISVNTGTAKVISTVGDKVTIEVTGGDPSRREQTGGEYIVEDTKFVMGQTGSNYNSGGYSGTLTGYVESGLAPVPHTKEVTGQTSPNYNSGGYEGTLSKYVYSGTITGGRNETKTMSRQTNLGVSPPYNSTEGYYYGRYWPLYYTHSVDIQGNLSWYTLHYYSGTVYRPEEDTRVWRYKGTVTHPGTDTRVWKYKGNVTKPASDTRTWQNYYQYSITVNYSATPPPAISSVTPSTTEWTNEDVELTVNLSTPVGDLHPTESYSFDGGTAWQTSNKFKAVSNGTFNVIVKNIVGITDSKQITISNIDKIKPKLNIDIKPQ